MTGWSRWVNFKQVNRKRPWPIVTTTFALSVREKTEKTLSQSALSQQKLEPGNIWCTFPQSVFLVEGKTVRVSCTSCMFMFWVKFDSKKTNEGWLRRYHALQPISMRRSSCVITSVLSTYIYEYDVKDRSGRAVFILSNTGIVGLNLTHRLNVCPHFFCVYVECRQRLGDGLIPRPGNPTNCLYDPWLQVLMVNLNSQKGLIYKHWRRIYSNIG
jgi:hypothetical protein